LLWVEETDDTDKAVQVASFEPVANMAGEALAPTPPQPATPPREADLIRALVGGPST
jgi:hypothetical protein